MSFLFASVDEATHQSMREFSLGLGIQKLRQMMRLTFPQMDPLETFSNDISKGFYRMSDHHHHLLNTHFIWLKLVSAMYVAAIPLAHGFLPHFWVWDLSLFFLAAMLFTYPIAAIRAGEFVTVEIAVSLGLITMGILGYFTDPVLLIAAIFGHGVWDFYKHRGAGVRFFRWYVVGCYIADWTYAAALLFFYVYGALG